MKKKKIIISISLLIIIILFTSFFIIDNKSKNKKALKEVASLITKQANLEKKLSTKGYTIDKPKVVLDPYEASPLTALVLFETNKSVEVTVTIKGKDDLTTYTNTFKKSKTHYLEIYGLYPDTDNEVLIEYKEGKKKISKTVSIKTEPLPENFVLPTNVSKEEDKLTNDLYFFTPSSIGYTCAYDTNGDVRWYLSNYALWDNARLENGHMLISTERLVNVPYYLTGLYEIDLLGKIYNEYSIPGGYHHDYYELPNGNLLVASDDFTSGEGTVEDYIVELDRKSGDVIKKIDLKDILDMEDGKSENWTSYDWFHNNSVWYDEKTNSITLSGRHQDAVINIDYDNLKLNWIIGDPTNWSKEYQKYFFKPIGDDFEWQWSQHAAMITPEGYVFILDNGNNKSKEKDKYVDSEDSYTRGVMYKIDTDKMTIEQVYEYGKSRGSEFYSPYISDVDYLDKNHYLIHSGGIVIKDGKSQNQPAGLGAFDELKSITVETKNDEVIFELELPTNNYRVEKMSIYSNDKYEKTKSKKLGTLGKTEINSTKIGTLEGKKIDKNYKSHNIKFTNEEDRLIFTGQFKRGVKVNVLLYKNLTSKVYNVPISKKPYTALCIDVFTEEENENGIVVTKYINKAGLTGKYSLYLEIDGKLYNTGRYVDMDEK